MKSKILLLCFGTVFGACDKQHNSSPVHFEGNGRNGEKLERIFSENPIVSEYTVIPEHFGITLQDYQNFSQQEREAFMEKVTKKTKAWNQELGVPQVPGQMSLEQADLLYKGFMRDHPNHPGLTYLRNQFSQILLKGYGAIERPGLAPYYTREMLESGIGEPALAARALAENQHHFTKAEVAQYRRLILPKLESVVQREKQQGLSLIHI